MNLKIRRSWLLAPAAVLAMGPLAGCDSMDGLLQVENPGVIGEPALGDPNLLPAMVNSAVGQFQSMYDNIVFAGAILTDEGVNGHNYDQWRQFDVRSVESSNSILGSDVYGPIQEARGAADDFARRIREIMGAEAESDLGLARVLAYAGYSYVVLGEYFCESPVRPDEGALTSTQILERAIAHFDDAIAVATAARNAGEVAARTDSIINLARVGAARAHLWIGNDALASQYASQVPDDFEMWVAYGSATSAPNNVLQSATSGASRYLGVDEYFRDLNDPRVRHDAEPTRGHNGLTDLWTPFQAPSHSEWTPEETATFQLGTNIRMASGLEARYIEAEAEGLTPENLLFINSRREVGGQGSVVLTTEAAFQAELRDQRRRDFFLDGHRLGDLRRYLERYGVDQFPSGAHPNEGWGNYGTATCFVPHNNESIGNPNY